MPSARDTGRTRPDTTTSQNGRTECSSTPPGLTPDKGSPPTPEADREHTTRRGVLTGTIAALLTGGAAATVIAAKAAPVPATGDDAELLKLAQYFWRQDTIVAQWNADQVTEEIGEAGHDRWWKCLEEISAILPTTDFGLRTKADCLLQGLEVVDSTAGVAEDYVRDFLADVAGRPEA